MDFRDGLSAELPDPRDDEPENLRADILDELADHLACSYRRELMRGADAATAKQRVLERFGDPAAVARRLWFEAMRGRIMSRRVLVGYSILLTLFCVGLLVMNGVQAARAQRELAHALMAEQAARAQQQAAQEEMLQRIEAATKAAAAGRSADWIPVAFTLSQEKIPGTPAEGISVMLGRGTGGSNKPDAMRRVSDSAGRVDFGVVQPGDWEFGIHLPFDPKTGNWTATGTLNVMPGTAIDRPIVCPHLPMEPVKVRPRVQWPEDLAGKGLLVEVQLQNQGFKYQPDLRWTSGQFFWNLVLGPASGEAHKLGGNGSRLWARSLPGAPIFADFPALSQTTAPGEWQPGQYQIRRLAILKSASGPGPGKALRAELLAFWARFQNEFGVELYDEPPDISAQEVAGGRPTIAVPQATLSVDSEKRLLDQFAATPGGTSEWMIVLPEELLQAAREKLKGRPATK